MKWEWTPERVAEALERLEEFRGTPHIHRRAIPGTGVDCVHLVYEAMKAGGVIPAVRLPAYRRDDGWNAPENYLENHFRFAFWCSRVESFGFPHSGDIVIFRVGRAVNHCGVYFGGEIWHSIAGAGVQTEKPGETENPVECFLRISAPGYRNDPRTDPAVIARRKHRRK